MIARAEAMHIETLAGSRLAARGQQSVRHGKILHGRQFEIRPLARNNRDDEPRMLGNGSVIGQRDVDGIVVRSQNLSVAKPLRCLRGGDAIARDVAKSF